MHLGLLLLVSAAALGVASPSATGSVRRLVVSGKDVSSSEKPGTPILLKGFNFGFKPGSLDVNAQDRNITTLFPGYLTESCLSMFDKVINWYTGDVKGWVVITARAAMAAGDGGTGHTVFTNDTMRAQMISMWAFLARRYKNVGGVAGYEVMSEPRTDNTNGVVHQFHEDACRAVWKEDQAAVCFIGPAKFYDRNHLGPEYLVKGGPVIYAANFFCPSNWITGKYKGIAYGGSGRCCDIGAKRRDCQSGCDQTITLDKSYLKTQMPMMEKFRTQYSVPLWIDQWGVHQDIGGGASSQRQYLLDVMELFEESKYHWSYWWYRDPTAQFHGCQDGYEIYCKPDGGNLHWNTVAIEAMAKYLGSPSSDWVMV